MRVIVTGHIAHLEQKGGKLVFVLEPDPATGIMMLKAEEVGGYLGQEVRDPHPRHERGDDKKKREPDRYFSFHKIHHQVNGAAGRRSDSL